MIAGALGIVDAMTQSHEEASAAASIEAAATIGLLLVTAVWYATGIDRLWQHRRGAGVSMLQATAFCSGLLVLGIALESPLPSAAHERFSAHMAQHLLLLTVAPALLALGHPEVVLPLALPARARRLLHRARAPVHRARCHPLVMSVAAVTALTAAVWLWHLPPLFDAAYRHDPLHLTEHATFFAAGYIFWWWVRVLTDGSRREQALALAVLVLAMFPDLLLGAVLTFATVPLYAAQQAAASQHGIDRLLDQQAGGLLMLMPMSFIYLAAAAAILLRLLHGHAFEASPASLEHEAGDV
jgi:cytochrome c oxidase assembly factor CtaG